MIRAACSIEVDVEAGPVVAEGVASHDFAPLGGECVQPVEFLGGETWWGHDQPCPEAAARCADEFPIPPCRNRQGPCKPRRDLN
jgi:hypothetical protein